MSDTATAAADPRRQVPMSVVDSAPHRQLAKEAAAQGVVLLKNNDHTLPLGGAGMTESIQQAVLAKISRGRARPLKLAVVGPNANRTLTLTSSYSGTRSFMNFLSLQTSKIVIEVFVLQILLGYPSSNVLLMIYFALFGGTGCKDRAGGPILPTCTFVNPLQGIQAAAAASSAFSDAVAFAPGVDIDTPDTSGIPAAVAAASDADVVVVIGGLITCQETGAQCQEAEARDRSTPVNKDGTDNPYSTADIGRDYGIGLPGQQLALLQTLANSTKAQIVLVIMSGSAVAVSCPAERHKCAARTLLKLRVALFQLMLKCDPFLQSGAVGCRVESSRGNCAALLRWGAWRGGAGRGALRYHCTQWEVASDDPDLRRAASRGLPRPVDARTSRTDVALLHGDPSLPLWVWNGLLHVHVRRRDRFARQPCRGVG